MQSFLLAILTPPSPFPSPTPLLLPHPLSLPRTLLSLPHTLLSLPRSPISFPYPSSLPHTPLSLPMCPNIPLPIPHPFPTSSFPFPHPSSLPSSPFPSPSAITFFSLTATTSLPPLLSPLIPCYQLLPCSQHFANPSTCFPCFLTLFRQAITSPLPPCLLSFPMPCLTSLSSHASPRFPPMPHLAFHPHVPMLPHLPYLHLRCLARVAPHGVFHHLMLMTRWAGHFMSSITTTCAIRFSTASIILYCCSCTLVHTNLAVKARRTTTRARRERGVCGVSALVPIICYPCSSPRLRTHDHHGLTPLPPPRAPSHGADALQRVLNPRALAHGADALQRAPNPRVLVRSETRHHAERDACKKGACCKEHAVRARERETMRGATCNENENVAHGAVAHGEPYDGATAEIENNLHQRMDGRMPLQTVANPEPSSSPAPLGTPRQAESLELRAASDQGGTAVLQAIMPHRGAVARRDVSDATATSSGEQRVALFFGLFN
ncbi:unnamed protein product [Closterium sp. Naga37s-1]|nr:unnamed protein product [Closterium sp. Naga37s-1]